MGGHRWHDATRNFTPSSFYLQCQERGEGRRPKQTDGQMVRNGRSWRSVSKSNKLLAQGAVQQVTDVLLKKEITICYTIFLLYTRLNPWDARTLLRNISKNESKRGKEEVRRRERKKHRARKGLTFLPKEKGRYLYLIICLICFFIVTVNSMIQ